jgi:23S rRNA pseudouridine1911/1915/1917 synthase
MKHIVKEDTNLLDVIMAMYKGISRPTAKQILAYSDILVNGKSIKKSAILALKEGDQIDLTKRDKDAKTPKIGDYTRSISIVYEDDHLIIAIKPAGLITSKDRTQPSIIAFHKILEDHLAKREGKPERIWSVHRLDKEVEGLVLFAKSEEIQNTIKENWSNVTKKYLALTEAKPAQESGTIENWLMDSYKQKVVSFKKEVENSRFAKTEYQFLETIGAFHLLEVKLHTGRKNQIRIHLSEMGCPIVGDYKYGASDTFKRQIRLAAYQLQFDHPVSGKAMSFEYRPHKKFFNPIEGDEKYKFNLRH